MNSNIEQFSGILETLNVKRNEIDKHLEKINRLNLEKQNENLKVKSFLIDNFTKNRIKNTKFAELFEAIKMEDEEKIRTEIASLLSKNTKKIILHIGRIEEQKFNWSVFDLNNSNSLLFEELLSKIKFGKYHLSFETETQISLVDLGDYMIDKPNSRFEVIDINQQSIDGIDFTEFVFEIIENEDVKNTEKFNIQFSTELINSLKYVE